MCQNHGGHYSECNAKEEITDEESQLQAKQTWAGKNIFETVSGFLQEASPTLCDLFGTRWLRNVDDHQRTNGKNECGNIKKQDARKPKDW